MLVRDLSRIDETMLVDVRVGDTCRTAVTAVTADTAVTAGAAPTAAHDG